MIEDSRDAALKASVLRELRLDPRVNETEIGVAVAHGVVTLTGRVDSEAEKKAAGQAAHHVEGVLDVANDLMVRIPFALGRTDADLAEAVRDALERSLGRAAAAIHSTVYDAVVTLTGEVETAEASEAAVRATREVAGVRRVDDRLVVRTAAVDLFAIHRSIEKALGRRARREAERIDLSLHDGVVTLEGRVNSDSDREAILQLVRHAPGVRRVDDRLRLAP
jgi:osmotically-inducible protein OsmY